MLLSHHPPSLFGHCLRVSFRGRSIYFCARCSGIYGGMFLGIPILLLLDSLLPYGQTLLEPKWMWFLLAVAFGLSTVFDWVTQRLTPRKTTVRIRAITGLLSGIGLAIVFMLGNLLYMLVTLAIMGLSVAGVSMAEARRARKK